MKTLILLLVSSLGLIAPCQRVRAETAIPAEQNPQVAPTLIWKEADMASFRAKLEQATANREGWTRCPEFIALEWAGPFIQSNGEADGVTREVKIKVDGSGCMTDRVTLEIIDDRCWDDVARTDAHRIQLQFVKDGHWKCIKGERAMITWNRR